MRKITVYSAVIVLFVTGLAIAQTPTTQTRSRFDVAAGISHLSGDVGMTGWDVTAGYNLNPWLAAMADISGYYGSDELLFVKVDNRVHNFLFGPRVYIPNSSRFAPFAEALFGLSRSDAKVATSGVGLGINAAPDDNSFGWAAGGGVEVKLTDALSARGKIDALRTNFATNSLEEGGKTHARVSLGLAYQFGGTR